MRKEKQKNRKAVPYNIPMVMACVLFCCTLVSMHFTGGLYARYTATDTSADGARAATFGQVTLTEKVDGETVTGLSATHIVTPGVDINKQVRVNLEACEVDTYVFVAVTADKWTVTDRTFTAGETTGSTEPVLSWAVDDQWNDTLGKVDDEYVYYIYVDSNLGLTDKDVIKSETITVSRYATADDIKDIDDYSLDFRAVVVQAGGFTGATPKDAALAAWNAVK